MHNETPSTTETIGLIDADLLCNGTRHPNLVLLKLAGFFRDHGMAYRLIQEKDIDVDSYKCIYLSRVFSFTTLPEWVDKHVASHPDNWGIKLKMGGTGFYATIEDRSEFDRKRREDMTSFLNDPLLEGFSMEHQMPDYNLYSDYIEQDISKRVAIEELAFEKKNGFWPSDEYRETIRAKHRKKYKDYLDYSIGFLTRGCVRQCSFCVNKGERAVAPYSDLTDFVDSSRPYIYLWDDNFLCYKEWRALLQKLIDTNKPFQFRQGLDERVLDDERAEMLSRARYHGDFIFAFDQWNILLPNFRPN